ncbi:PREDICTED: uncharacterized protein LOC104718364 [Camelina sativa]|uniref:Uncharacterized protein LOC104718364 n=1 Tax=Camelina sativa TaxID=90675 RepID=A0ABM0U1C0_CAMSA|nr:PREDICTED: uncharacterized protein LOC104718364 [Camelina sativa]
MVGKSVKLSSKDVTPVKLISRGLVSDSIARNIKVCRNKGDLSDISDAEVAGYLSNKEEFIFKKRAWELMNPEYQKGKRRKVANEKKKDPANKTAPSKKAFATRTPSNVETENAKRPSLEINYDALDKLFGDDNSPKRDNLEKAVGVGDQVEYSNHSSEESLLKPPGSEEEEPAWSEDYSNEDAYRGDEECYGNEDLEFEDEVEEEDDEGIIW